VELLNSNNPSYVCSAIQSGTYEDGWDQVGECGEYLASCLEVGDNFVVNTKEGNEEDVDFYLVLCTLPIHIVAKDFINSWKPKFKEGNVAMAETYYQKWGQVLIIMSFCETLQQCLCMCPMSNPLNSLCYLLTTKL